MAYLVPFVGILMNYAQVYAHEHGLRKQLTDEITERTIAEERFRATVEASPSATVMMNRQGSITLVNAHTEILFGYQRDELLGQKIELLIPERFRSRHVGQRDGFIGRGLTNDRWEPGENSSGFAKMEPSSPSRIGLSPLETLEGIQVLASVIDITERKCQERLLHRHLDELTRTNQELDEFAYVASHDLRSPLEGINKLAKWVSKDNADLLSDKSKRHLRADAAADRPDGKSFGRSASILTGWPCPHGNAVGRYRGTYTQYRRLG